MLTITHGVFSAVILTGAVTYLARVISARVVDTRTRSAFARVYRGGTR
jgi:hypothetical protein